MSEANQALQNEVAGLIVTALNLEIGPDDIQPDAPLYGEGLGSIPSIFWKWPWWCPSSSGFHCARITPITCAFSARWPN